MIEFENKTISKMNELLGVWTSTYSQPDIMTKVATMLRDLSASELVCLESIKKELVPSCKHPKKMHDRLPNGDVYCMNCNMDL